MLVSIRHRLVILATPKCASTAIEDALGTHMDVVVRGHPGAKHTNYRKFNRHLRRYLESYADGRMETVCLFREPVDWLHSWWRYRGRADIPDKSKSTRGMTFDAFANAYLDGAAGPADLGRQSRFVADANGEVGVDHVFRYDRVDRMAAWLAERLEMPVALDRLNVSPAAHGPDMLALATAERARRELARDYEIYAVAR